MGPYMKQLERVLGYRSLKAKFSRAGPIEELVVDEEDSEVSVRTTYKSPILEKDEMISALQKEKESIQQEKDQLTDSIPELQEDLIKTKSKLAAIQKTVRQKTNQINQAAGITEKRLAEAISLDPAYLRDNPHLVTLLAVFQERDDFDVDTENDVVKPVHEDTFLMETLTNVMSLNSQTPNSQHMDLDQCKERLGDTKNQLLESVKQRWMKPGRRNSFGSQASTVSKRDRDEDSASDRSNRRRTSTLQAL